MTTSNTKSQVADSKRKKKLLRAALGYAKRGWPVFPLQPGLKIPFPETHGHKEATTDRKIIKHWWIEAYPGANIGIVCGGEGGLVVVDVDGSEAEAVLKSLNLPATLEATTGRDSNRHLYLASNGKRIGRLIRPFGDAIPLDIIGAGYVVAPPSYRLDTDSYYAWTTNGETPVATLPTSSQQRIEEAQSSKGSGSKRNGRATGDQIDLRNKKIPDVITEGERDTTLTSLAGSMRRRGASEEAIYAALREENELKCSPPLPDKQVRKIARSIAKKDPDTVEEAVRELNRTWAAVSMGGKMRYIKEKSDGTIEFWSRREFIDKLESHFIWVPKGVNGELVRRPLSKTWLEEEGRREYDELVFEPGAPKDEKVYNLWRGFAIEPSEDGSCDLFLAHIHENICRGKAKYYDWVLGWFAQLIQDPGHKLDTAMVLRGPQGTGKSIVGKTIGRLLGSYYFTASSPRYVTGQFNAHLECVLLLHAEEAFWAGDKRAEGVLKDLITNDTQPIERKGLESFRVANHLRLLVTSNHKWVVPAGVQDRRFAVFDVGDGHQQDTAYFGAMLKQLEEGGYANLLHTLQHHPYDEDALRHVPKTAARREQIEESLSPDEKWLLDLLTTGHLSGGHHHQASDRVKAAIGYHLHADFVEHARSSGVSHRASVTAFGIFLHKWFLRRRHESAPTININGKQHRAIWLPSLEEARARWDELIGKRRWEKPHRWQVGGL